MVLIWNLFLAMVLFAMLVLYMFYSGVYGIALVCQLAVVVCFVSILLIVIIEISNERKRKW